MASLSKKYQHYFKELFGEITRGQAEVLLNTPSSFDIYGLPKSFKPTFGTIVHSETISSEAGGQLTTTTLRLSDVTCLTLVFSVPPSYILRGRTLLRGTFEKKKKTSNS